MASLNRVEILGRLGKDPEQKSSQTGTTIAVFSVATDESVKNREGTWEKRTEWHRITVFGKQAENCLQYLHKGSQVLIEGSLQTRSWQDQQGQKHSVVEIKTYKVYFLDTRQQGQNNGGGNFQQPITYDQNAVTYQDDFQPPF